jgi:predicted ArsR family transcriptional regulator
MFVLKGILRAESQEKILLYLLARESGYGKAIAEFFSLSTNSVQKQLVRLEEDSVVVSRSIGRLREYQLNPRYAFSEPLRQLLKSALRVYPDTVVNDLTMPRTRPRKNGKPETYVRR